MTTRKQAIEYGGLKFQRDVRASDTHLEHLNLQILKVFKNMRKNEFIQRGLEREEQGKVETSLFMREWLQGERSQTACKLTLDSFGHCCLG